MKAKKVITTIFTALVAAMVFFSGIMKILHIKDAVDKLTSLGVGKYITLLGAMEIVFMALFLFPKTMKLGFILLSCYFAGAMATDLSHNSPVINAGIPLTLIWIAAFLRDRSIFLPSSDHSMASVK